MSNKGDEGCGCMSLPQLEVGRAARSCSWCHHLNDERIEFCEACGYEAHVSRADCRCRLCQKEQPRADLLPFRRKGI